MIPDLEFGDYEDLQHHGGFGRTLWNPGHTPRSQCVLLPDGTVLAGDALTEGILPLHSAEGQLFVEDPRRQPKQHHRYRQRSHGEGKRRSSRPARASLAAKTGRTSPIRPVAVTA